MIVIDLDLKKFDLVKYNVVVYGVVDKIDFVKGDFFELVYNLKVCFFNLFYFFFGFKRFLFDLVYNLLYCVGRYCVFIVFMGRF